MKFQVQILAEVIFLAIKFFIDVSSIYTINIICDIFNLFSVIGLRLKFDSIQLYFIKGSSARLEINGGLMVQGQNYMVDASKLPSQTLFIFAKSKMCVVWRCHDGRQRPFY